MFSMWEAFETSSPEVLKDVSDEHPWNMPSKRRPRLVLRLLTSSERKELQ